MNTFGVIKNKNKNKKINKKKKKKKKKKKRKAAARLLVQQYHGVFFQNCICSEITLPCS